jgi:hypothetical protein
MRNDIRKKCILKKVYPSVYYVKEDSCSTDLYTKHMLMESSRQWFHISVFPNNLRSKEDFRGTWYERRALDATHIYSLHCNILP